MAKSRTAKAGVVTALDFLAQSEAEPQSRRGEAAPASDAPVYVIFGDDAYLKSAVLAALRRQILGGDENELSLTTLAGDEAQFRDVLDALATVSLFGSRRLVVVEEADAFVSLFRQELEDYVARPYQSGTLILEVKSWRSNTRLAKALATVGQTIDCQSPNERQTRSWLIRQAKSVHQVRLEAAAADALLELLPPELGILEQELAKLAVLVGEDRVIQAALVRDHVGGWRTRTTWEMIDAAADGEADVALAQLDRLISAGERPHGLLPQMASTLRRFAVATARIEAAEAARRRLTLGEALIQARVPPFKRADAERQLRQIGRNRAKQIHGWLLAADLAIKGHNSSEERARGELERLIVRLSAAALVK